MNKNEIEGSADKAKGKVKEAVGKGTHSPTTEAEGRADQVKGEVKKQAGKVQDAITDEHRSEWN